MALGVTADIITTNVSQALREDLGAGDVSAALLPRQQPENATIISREAGIFCGRDWATEVFQQIDATITINWLINDGDAMAVNQTLCRLRGRAASLVSGERTALNFLQTLSGTATTTQAYVRAIAETGCKLLDTRKTLPGLRHAQKYAVRCAGGSNHRMGLYDAFLIKENHIQAAGSITEAITAARLYSAELPLVVEVENLAQLQEAITARADRVLLDNFDLAGLRRAVALNQNRSRLEASGNIDLTNIRAIAETGVDYISIGALTKHVRAIDLSLRFAR